MMDPTSCPWPCPPPSPPSGPVLRRLRHFLDLYEDGVYPDPAGVHCQSALHSAIGAAALKQHTTITDLLQPPCPPDGTNADLSTVAHDSPMGDATELENFSLDNTQVDHSAKDYSTYVVIAQSEIDRIEAAVRGRKLQEQGKAVELANQLQRTFSVWQHDDRGTGFEAYNSRQKPAHATGDHALVEPCSVRNSTDTLGYVALCQFLIDLELGMLGNENLHGTWQRKDVASLRPDLDLELEVISDIEQQSGVTTNSTSRQRSLSVENRVDNVAYHKLQQKLSYLLEFRGKLDDENWRAGVDLGMIFAYFKVLLEFLMNQSTASFTCLADLNRQLMLNQEDLQTIKNSLVESSREVQILRTENTALSFVDHLTEEIESCETEISKEVKLRSELEDQGASVKALVKISEETEWEHAAELTIYEVLNESALSSLQERQDAKVKTLMKALEEIEWRHTAESSIYLDFMNEATGSCLRKQQDQRLKEMTDKLEETEWEHAVESSIYLELVNEMALSYSQESRYNDEPIKERELEERPQKEVAEVGRLKREIEDSAWKHKLESCISLEILDSITLQYSQEIKQSSDKLNMEEARQRSLQTEVEQLIVRLNEFEFSNWRSTGESTIYFAMLDNITSKLAEEIEHLRAELSIEGASLVKLQVLHAGLERSMKELERISTGQQAESSFCLEIVGAVAQEWALEVNRALFEFRRNEGALQRVLERKDTEIKKLTEELELTLWEHEAESSIYLEVVGERACEWRQLIDSLAGDFNRKQIVRRKELQASCSFSGRTHKEKLALEDAPPLGQGDLEGLKSALRKPSPLKGLSALNDQSVSSPGKATDPIYVVVRRNTQAAVEGFMVDIGESPSKRTNKEVVSSLKLEVLDLRREKEQLIDHHTDEMNKLEFKLRNECERMKVELGQECQNELARLQVKLESRHREESEQIKDEMNQKFQIEITDLEEKMESEYRKRTEAMEVELKQRYQFETAGLREILEVEYRKLIEKTKVEVEQNHLNEIADLQKNFELEHRKEVERTTLELQQKHEADLANLQQKLDYEATKRGERKSIELEQIFQGEIAALEEKLVKVKQKLGQGLKDKKRLESCAEGGRNILSVIPRFGEIRESSNTSLETISSINDTLTQFESEVVTLVAERDELCERLPIMELQIFELQEKVTKLEGERSWLEERVPGLEKKLATEQSRLEDTVAGHAFERDQLKLIVSSHKNEQTKLENELAERKAERNYLATAIAMLALACRNLKVSKQNERERWRSAYMMALKDMERALSRTQKQVKEERAQKGSAESDAQRMKAEIYTMQQESKDVWRVLERTLAEHISRAVGTSQQVEFGLCRKIHQQTLRFEAVQQQVENLLQVLRQSQMSEMDYLHTVENLQRAEQEVDVLGDEVDSLVALLEKVHLVMEQYAPVLLHYPGVAEVAKLVGYELCQRDLLPNVPT